MPLACKYCILTKGLKGSEIGQLPQNEEELADHIEREHHMVVRRENETQADADRRVLAAGIACDECKEVITARLAR